MIKLSNFSFVIYVIVIAIVASLLSIVFSYATAKEFDYYYRTLMIISVSLYSILFNERKAIDLFKKHLVIGVTVGIIASVVCDKFEKANHYFSFEMDIYSWNGVDGILNTVMVTIISSIIGMTLWYLKRLIIKLLPRWYRYFFTNRED